jgi:hypothetical protein
LSKTYEMIVVVEDDNTITVVTVDKNVEKVVEGTVWTAGVTVETTIFVGTVVVGQACGDVENARKSRGTVHGRCCTFVVDNHCRGAGGKTRGERDIRRKQSDASRCGGDIYIMTVRHSNEDGTHVSRLTAFYENSRRSYRRASNGSASRGYSHKLCYDWSEYRGCLCQ